ncbi:glycosyltransferase family 2 protein [Lachnospiraceae bacterium 29-84]
MGLGNRKVQVLMSTYNGEKYLAGQLDSLLTQEWEDLELLIRDDGSSDGTQGILEDYHRRYQNIQLFFGENMGVARSFFVLLAHSDADYVAFCDQDDVWEPTKIAESVRSLEAEQGPALYCSNTLLVDEHLNPCGIGRTKTPRIGFGNAVVENICTGCTMVINRELASQIKGRIPKEAVMHDWWIYLVACYLGGVRYDPTPRIRYRQHSGNVVGESNGILGRLRHKAAYVRKNRGKLRRQLAEFSSLYQGDPQKDQLVQDILDAERWPKRLKMAKDSRIFRQDALDGMVMRLLLLIGWMP